MSFAAIMPKPFGIARGLGGSGLLQMLLQEPANNDSVHEKCVMSQTTSVSSSICVVADGALGVGAVNTLAMHTLLWSSCAYCSCYIAQRKKFCTSACIFVSKLWYTGRKQDYCNTRRAFNSVTYVQKGIIIQTISYNIKTTFGVNS